MFPVFGQKKTEYWPTDSFVRNTVINLSEISTTTATTTTTTSTTTTSNNNIKKKKNRNNKNNNNDDNSNDNKVEEIVLPRILQYPFLSIF